MISETPGGLRWERDIAESEQGAGFFGNVIVRTLLIAAVFPLMALIGLFAFLIHPTSSLIILHYSVYFGVDVLGDWWQAYLIPFLTTFFLFGHIILAKNFYDHSERIAAYLLILSAGWISVGALVSGVSIAFINY
jgi:hypothetical protein